MEALVAAFYEDKAMVAAFNEYSTLEERHCIESAFQRYQCQNCGTLVNTVTKQYTKNPHFLHLRQEILHLCIYLQNPGITKLVNQIFIFLRRSLNIPIGSCSL